MFQLFIVFLAACAHLWDRTASDPIPPTEQHLLPTQPEMVEMTSVLPDDVATGASLLYCNTLDLRKLDLDTNQDSVLVADLNDSMFLDYDHARNIVVWTEVQLQAIFRADLSTFGNKMLLVSNVASYGVAVDWMHGNVYWTDSSNDVIEVITLDGRMRKTLFGDMLEFPRGIVLNPSEGYMYWTDWGPVPKIEKAGMDGSGRRVIVSVGLKWPNGLVIDLPERRLYWIEAFYSNLCTSNLEGKDIRKIITKSYSSYSLMVPISIDVFQEWVYWNDWTAKEKIFKADKVTGKNITAVLDGETTIMGFKLYHPSKQIPGVNRCGAQNGLCPHLCLPTPHLPGVTANFTCACANGFIADGAKCMKEGGNTSSELAKEIQLVYVTPGGVTIAVGVIATLVLVALAFVVVYCRQLHNSILGHNKFNNPVYRKHTEESGASDVTM